MIQYSSPANAAMWARFSATSTQNITSAATPQAGNKLAFQRVEKSDNWPAVTLPATDITIPVTGLWLIVTHDLDWGDSSTGAGLGFRAITKRINDVVNSSRRGASASPTLSASATPTVTDYSEIRPLTAGATIQFYGSQNSGSTLAAAMNNLGLYLLTPMATNPYLDTDN